MREPKYPRSEEELTDAIPDKLHPNVKKWWMGISALVALLCYLPVFLLMVLELLMLGETVPALKWIAGSVIVFALYFGIGYWYISKFYHSYTFLITNDAIEIRTGVWLKFTSVIPYANISKVSYNQGPIEKWLGISTILIQWGVMLPGIEDPRLLVDILLKRVARTKDGKVAPVAPGSENDSIDRQILYELREIRKGLQKEIA